MAKLTVIVFKRGHVVKKAKNACGDMLGRQQSTTSSSSTSPATPRMRRGAGSLIRWRVPSGSLRSAATAAEALPALRTYGRRYSWFQSKLWLFCNSSNWSKPVIV